MAGTVAGDAARASAVLGRAVLAGGALAAELALLASPAGAVTVPAAGAAFAGSATAAPVPPATLTGVAGRGVASCAAGAFAAVDADALTDASGLTVLSPFVPAPLLPVAATGAKPAVALSVAAVAATGSVFCAATCVPAAGGPALTPACAVPAPVLVTEAAACDALDAADADGGRTSAAAADAADGFAACPVLAPLASGLPGGEGLAAADF